MRISRWQPENLGHTKHASQPSGRDPRAGSQMANHTPNILTNRIRKLAHRGTPDEPLTGCDRVPHDEDLAHPHDRRLQSRARPSTHPRQTVDANQAPRTCRSHPT
jgi:hypothetical protein